MFSNVQFLTMEENSFTVVNVNKNTENYFLPENPLFYTQSLNTLPPNPHPPILPIKL